MTRFSRKPDTTTRARELKRHVSRSEARLWPWLRASQLGAPFRRQHPIGPYFADYCCVPLKLVVEIDGPDHDLRHDRRRDAFLSAKGFEVLRFSAADAADHTEAVVEAIANAVAVRLQLEQHSKPSPLPTPARGR